MNRAWASLKLRKSVAKFWFAAVKEVPRRVARRVVAENSRRRVVRRAETVSGEMVRRVTSPFRSH